MKHYSLSNRANTLRLLIAGLVPLAWSALAGQDIITRSAVPLTRPACFSQPVAPVGESKAAVSDAAAIQKLMDQVYAKQGPAALMDALEDFIRENPNSPWTPCLQINAGKFFFDNGFYTRALKQWEDAWEANKQYPDGEGKHVADYAYAHWTRLLLIMGRNEALTRLFEETKDRVYDGGPLSQMVRRTLEEQRNVQRNPANQRCGSLALYQVLLKLEVANPETSKLVLSKENNWSLGELAGKANQAKVGLIAVERNSGDEIPVPSVMHFKQNHFVAILERRGDSYEVFDPGMSSRRFSSAAALNSEASGKFLMPAQALSKVFRQLSPQESAVIMGRCNVKMADNCDLPRWRSEPIVPPSVPPECSRVGMPVWRISEPYLNLWIEDVPLVYESALGEPVPLRLGYKERDEETNLDPQVFAFGQGWNSEWLSYVDVTSLSDSNSADVYFPGGGQATMSFPVGGSAATNYYNNSVLKYFTDGTGVTNFVLSYPDGVQYEYGFLRRDNSGQKKQFFLSLKRDKQGFPTRFNYFLDTGSLSVILQSLTAADGRSITFEYTNGPSHTNLVSAIHIADTTNTVTLSYNDSGQVVQVVDAAGLVSSFDWPDRAVIPRSMTTPYGTATFTSETPGTAFVGRSQVVTNFDGGVHIFAIYETFNYTNYVIPSYLIPNIPANTCDTNNLELRNSFYWDPKQTMGWPQDAPSCPIDTFAGTNFLRARLRHWLASVPGALQEVEGTLAFERAPSPDGVNPGQITWYDYSGKPANNHDLAGTQILPKTIARVLPYLQANGTTNWVTWYETYQRNAWGYATNVTSTYGEFSNPLTRTWSFIYTNGIDLSEERGPSNELIRFYTYNDRHQLLAATEYPTPNSTPVYSTTYQYDASNRLWTLTRPTGSTITYSYYTNTDTTANRLRLQGLNESAIGRAESFTWDAGGRPAYYTDARGLARTHTWDGLGRLLRVDYPGGIFELHSYSLRPGEGFNPLSNTTNINILDRTEFRDRANHWTSLGIDRLRRVVSATDAENRTTYLSYCDCGALEHVQDALQQVTQFTNDFAGRRIATAYLNASQQAVESEFFHYDTLGRLVRYRDTAGQTVSNAYNLQGLLCQVNDASGQLLALQYDGRDRATNRVDAHGIAVRQVFDNLDRPLVRTYPDNSTERFAYGAAGLSIYTNRLNLVTTFAYDAAGRKTNQIQASGIAACATTTSYAYNAAGDLVRLNDGQDHRTTWAYDEYGRATNKVDAASQEIFRYQYDPVGRLTKLWSVAGGYITNDYDQVGNLTNLLSSDITNRYAYDALNRLTNMVDVVGATRYTYDRMGFRQAEDGPWANDTVTITHTNRLRASLNLEQPGASAWTQFYGYDSAKRLRTVASPASLSGTFTYSYPTVPGVVPGPASPLPSRVDWATGATAYSYVLRTFFTS